MKLIFKLYSNKLKKVDLVQYILKFPYPLLKNKYLLYIKPEY